MSNKRTYRAHIVAKKDYTWEIHDERGIPMGIHYIPASQIGAPDSSCKVGDTGTLKYIWTPSRGFYTFTKDSDNA